MDWSKDHFQDLVMCLLRDKDHEKVMYIVYKVKKSHRRKSREREDRGASVAHSTRPFNTQCYFCNRRGHIRLTALIGSPVIPNRLSYQTSRLCSDRTGIINVDGHYVLYVCFPQY